MSCRTSGKLTLERHGNRLAESGLRLSTIEEFGLTKHLFRDPSILIANNCLEKSTKGTRYS